MKKFFEDFKAFAMRGNVIDMAVGVIIGAAFGSITTSLVNDIFMPLIGVLTGGINFGGLFIALDGGSYVSAEAAAAAGVILAVVRRGKPHAHWGGWLLLLGLVLFAGGRLMLTIYPLGTTVACVAVPLLALAGFVYYLYQREFFCAGLGVGVAIAGMWFARRAADSASWSGKALIVEIVLLVIVLAVLAFALSVGRNGGKWGKEEREKVIFSGTTNYRVMYGVLILAATALLAAMFAPAAAMYLMWVGIVLLFVLAVYYTIHLM